MAMVDEAPSPLTVDECEEAAERRSAEIELVASAYSPEEVCISKDIINRRLRLRFGGSVVQVNLTLKLPEAYPIREDAILIIDASLHSCPTNPPHIRKAALNAIPYLVETCQLNAKLVGAGEAIWSVLASADEWVCDNKLEDYVQTTSQKANSQSNTTDTENDDIGNNSNTNTLILGRRVIYSHHIIANSKRRGLADLASQYNLGGYAKIGWPGIILIEGDESNCQLFVEEIKRWRWQQIQVRGEEQSNPIIAPSQCLDDLRLLPMKFEEIEESDGGLSTLAAKCREVGLERLFLTCMKINDHRTKYLHVEEEGNTATENGIKDSGSKEYYGILVHVDHMNDQKRYHKWLKKTCQTNGCTLLIRQVYKDKKSDNDDTTTTKKPKTIIVAIFGEQSSSVKHVMKQWRTNRVDVDSKNKPCLERMMKIMEEGVVHIATKNALCSEDEIVAFDELEKIIAAVDRRWAENLRNHIQW